MSLKPQKIRPRLPPGSRRHRQRRQESRPNLLQSPLWPQRNLRRVRPRLRIRHLYQRWLQRMVYQQQTLQQLRRQVYPQRILQLFHHPCFLQNKFHRYHQRLQLDSLEGQLSLLPHRDPLRVCTRLLSHRWFQLQARRHFLQQQIHRQMYPQLILQLFHRPCFRQNNHRRYHQSFQLNPLKRQLSLLPHLDLLKFPPIIPLLRLPHMHPSYPRHCLPKQLPFILYLLPPILQIPLSMVHRLP
mmetsp:Transcript_26464/g.32442  ORF Transcript_26464/g.32442 Transcript_26464/m.32442 type:complete len:242 (-) Transcript_26464:392-1117(-)